MTLDEWQRQAEVILARQAAEKASRPNIVLDP
jgi:hypothetical protein